jgi:hypothetical protein
MSESIVSRAARFDQLLHVRPPSIVTPAPASGASSGALGGGGNVDSQLIAPPLLSQPLLNTGHSMFAPYVAASASAFLLLIIVPPFAQGTHGRASAVNVVVISLAIGLGVYVAAHHTPLGR